MSSTIGAPATDLDQDAQSAGKDFKQNLKTDILTSVREGLVSARTDAQASGDVKTVAKLDAAIAKLDRQLATDGQTIVQVPRVPTIPSIPAPPGVPGIQVPYPGPYYRRGRDDMPAGAVDVMQGLFVTIVLCVVGLPIARAFARWIDRRGTSAPESKEVSVRLEAIEQAVESVAVEVERISEGQRFTTKLLNERVQDAARDYAAAERDPIASLPANSRRS